MHHGNTEQRNDPTLGKPGQKDCVSATVNKEQLNRQVQAKLELHKTRRSVDEEGELKDTLSLNKPACQPLEDGQVQGKLAPFDICEIENLCSARSGSPPTMFYLPLVTILVSNTHLELTHRTTGFSPSNHTSQMIRHHGASLSKQQTVGLTICPSTQQGLPLSAVT